MMGRPAGIVCVVKQARTRRRRMKVRWSERMLKVRYKTSTTHQPAKRRSRARAVAWELRRQRLDSVCLHFIYITGARNTGLGAGNSGEAKKVKKESKQKKKRIWGGLFLRHITGALRRPPAQKKVAAA